MFCPNCGTEIDKKAKFCSECGWKNKLSYPNEKSNIEKAVNENVSKVKNEISENLTKVKDSTKENISKVNESIGKNVDKAIIKSGDALGTIKNKLNKIFAKANFLTIVSAFLFRYGAVLVPFVKFNFDNNWQSDKFIEYGNIHPTLLWYFCIDLLDESPIFTNINDRVIFLQIIFIVYPLLLIILAIFNNILTNIICIILGLIVNGFFLLISLMFIINHSAENYLPYTTILFACSTILLIVSCIIGIRNRIKYKKSLKLAGGK